MKTLKYLIAVSALLISACDKTDRSFSLLSDANTFQQSPNFVPRKIDILWVVDNSGSMATSQQKLTDNFTSFINKFKSKNYDFHMAVTTTDAYLGLYTNKAYYKRLRPGVLNTSNGTYSPSSGVFVMDKATPNLTNVFLTNAKQGTTGSGDERAFQSFKDTLGYTGNSDFLRSGAFLSIIMISDEDDMSSETPSYYCVACDYSDTDLTVYNDPRLTSVQSYNTYLKNLVGADNFSVNTISIQDSTCQATLNAQNPGRKIGTRYNQIADMSKGLKISLCGDFAAGLDNISQSILSLSSAFKLGREPLEATIRPTVNGAAVVQNTTNGWSYDATTWTVTFHGTAIPDAGATIQISFDPKNAIAN